MTFKTIPFKSKEGALLHEDFSAAKERAQRVANKTNDWVAIETIEDGRPVPDLTKYIHPNNARRR